MSALSNHNCYEDKNCHDKNICINTKCNNFTTLGYSASLKSMRYSKAKRNKPVHL